MNPDYSYGKSNRGKLLGITIVAIILIVAAVVGSRLLFGYKTVTLEASQGIKVEIGTLKSGESPQINESLAETTDTTTIRLKNGTYAVHFSGTDYKDQTHIITVPDVTNVTVPKLDFSAAKLSSVLKQVSIHSVASQLGENTAEATAEVTGDGAITLNSRYILDALQVMGGTDASLSFNGKLEPSVLRDPASKDYTHVIMPLKS